MGHTPDSRLRIRIIMVGIILATLPCYCTGFVVARLAQLQPSFPTEIPALPPTSTLPPANTPVPLPSATLGLLQPSVTATFTATPTLFPTKTPIPTLTHTLQPTATNTSPPPPPTFTPTFIFIPSATWTPPPTPTENGASPSATPGDTG